MAWGILEDHQTPRPPGTVLLQEQDQRIDPDDPDYRDLKRHGDIILQPQPSDSPNDPLNWPLTRKITIFATIMLVMTAMGAILGMLDTAGRILMEKYHTSYPNVIQHLGPPGTATTAITFFLSSALAAVYGKRFQLVIGIIGLWLSLFVGIFARSLNWYTAVSVLQGFFTAPYELLLPAIATDLIFVHQRGRLMGITAIIYIVGSDAGQVISGNIINRLGVKYLFIVSFAVLAPMIPLVYFLVWETAYLRKIPKTVARSISPQQGQNAINDKVLEDEKHTKDTTVGVEHAVADSHNTSATEVDLANEPEESRRERLRLWRGRITDRSFWKSLVEPIPLLAFPAVLFATVVNGAYLAWIVTTAVIQYQMFLFKPYDMKPDTLAYLSLPGSAVYLLASIFAGIISDRLIQRMARGNKGIYEPEFRLVMMIPAVIISTCGFLAMGRLFDAKAKAWKIVCASLLFPLANPFATLATTPYILDIMQNTTTEAFVIISLFRNVFILIITSNVPGWFEKVGPLKVHNTLMIVNLAVSSMTIPVYIFGKKARGAIYRTPALQIYAKDSQASQRV